jgi:Zn-dependent M16 (insulinase) family peptidase
MTDIHGFKLVRETQIPEINARAEFFRHTKTGAELLSIINDDKNKVFGISFRTPPEDSTGVAHILEHSVLCGSRKYPVKEPFVELLKGSLKTFLNAFTYPDKTCYPVASQNLQDFYNLIDVYLDAVFHPRITKDILQQEGWHYELATPEDPMTYKGVVYNEMKGAYSSPDNILGEKVQQSLFPDTPYGIDSGGDPKKIPDLTYEQFYEFHRRYYHPSNSRIFFSGDDDPVTRLEIADSYLGDFDRLELNSTIPLQASFSEPGRLTVPYDPGEVDDGQAKGMITLNWLFPEEPEPVRTMAYNALNYILLGMPGSPLRKALIDSGLGEALAGGGLEDELCQLFFSTGLKGVLMEDAEKVEAVVLETLKKLSVKRGIKKETVEAALNTIEFSLRENNTGNFPQGLLLMLRSLTTWLYDRDPLALVAFEAPLNELKKKVSENPDFFSDMIEQMFLNNPHRTMLILKPEPGFAVTQATEEEARLQKAKDAMTPGEIQGIIDNTQTLRSLQEAPDSPEALATIPSLKLDDLERKNKIVPIRCQEHLDTEILTHDLFTNGIIYLDVGFNLHGLKQGLLPYIRLFARALLEMGTDKEDYVSLSERISRKTGGIHSAFFTSALHKEETGSAWMFLRGKAVADKTEDLLEILKEVLLGVKLDDRNRFKQMVLESKARKEQALIPSGHQVVTKRLSSHFSEADWVSEQISGLDYLFFLRELADLIDQDWPGVLATLEEVRNALVHRGGMILNVTVDQKGWSSVEPLIEKFLGSIPSGTFRAAKWARVQPPFFEGLTIPARVNYVGKGAAIYPLGYRFHGSALVITKHIRNSWLWDRIRVQGGAYGAFCSIDRFSGALTFVSYRDPNLLKTLDVFDESAKFLRTTPLGHEVLSKAIIGTIGEIDQHRLPDAEGHVSMLRWLTNQTEEERQQIRDEVLGTTEAHFREFADVLDKVGKTGIVKVLGSKETIEDASKDREGWLQIRKIL